MLLLLLLSCSIMWAMMMKNEALWMKAAQSNVVTTDCGSLNRASDSEITLFWLFKGHPLKGHICAKGWANRIPLVSYTNLPLRYCPHTFPDSQVTSNTMVRKTVYNFGSQFFHGLSCSCSLIMVSDFGTKSLINNRMGRKSIKNGTSGVGPWCWVNPRPLIYLAPSARTVDWSNIRPHSDAQ